MQQSFKIVNSFITSTLKQVFWKTQTLFKKTAVMFLVESAKIETATWPYKTVLSEANVRTNRMGSTKWIYSQKQNISKFYFSLRTSYSWFDVPTTKRAIFILFENVRVLFEGAVLVFLNLLLMIPWKMFWFMAWYFII